MTHGRKPRRPRPVRAMPLNMHSIKNPPRCDYCMQQTELVQGDVIYPHRPDLTALRFWLCRPCDAYVGCHKEHAFLPGLGISDGTWPLGRLANAELRMWKSRAHAAFDPIWKSGRMHRNTAYAWLAVQLGIRGHECHIGMFDVERCRATVACIQKLTTPPKAS